MSWIKSLCAVLVLLGASTAYAAPVLLISIDGMRPGEVIEAQKRGLKIPNLRRFLTEGSYADSVTGVMPTLTYPSHTTLLTGVDPATHGIVSNTTFDPYNINGGGWFWYSSDIRVPTLWDAARASGMTVGNVHWPVSVGAQSITWNLPQIWRSGHADDDKLIGALTTPGLLEPMEKALGKYAPGIAETIEADETRGKFAVKLINDKKPDFLTVYLTALDHTEHLTGPGSAESHAVLERIDAIVGQLIAAEHAARPDAVVSVVSDHGFAATTKEINFFRPFIDDGLIVVGPDGKVKSWDASPWISGGSVAVILARPDDAVLIARVRALLDRVKANPDAQIATIIDRAEIRKRGGNPDASCYIELSKGALTGLFDAKAPLSKAAGYRGMHGYFPTNPEMRSTFLIMGPGVAKGKSLGDIDMRAIAPTLANVLGIALPTAQTPALDVATH
jgi:predicted AlkP superfamily pyrophosphatase or phosphodiesterase